MENLKPQTETKENNLFEIIRNEFNRLSFSREELLEIFNKKYPSQEESIAVVDHNGNPWRGREDKLTNVVGINKLSDQEKIDHVVGSILLKFKENRVDYVKELAKEKELLEIAFLKMSNLKKLVAEYLEKEGKEN